MRKSIVFILALLLSQNTVFAGGLQASFTGSPTSPCDVTCDQYSVACYDSDVDGSGNLLDKSGCNLLVQSEDFGTTWTTTRASIVTNQAKNPVDGALTADALVEDGTAANTHSVEQGSVSLVSGVTYTASMYISAGSREWVELYISGENIGRFFRLNGNGVIGTAIGINFSPRIHRVNENWYRCSFSFTATATAARIFRVYIAEADNDNWFDGLSTTSLYLFGAQVREQRNVTDTNPGRYIATVAANKPWHDLAPNNAPGRAVTSLQGSDGNRLAGRSFIAASSQYYSKADHDSLDVFDADHTATVIVKTNDGVTGQRVIWSKGAYQASGGYFFIGNASNVITYILNKAGANCNTTIPMTDTNDGEYHIIQMFRRSSINQICVNGTCSTPLNCATYGIDGATNFTLGASSTGSNPQDGSVLYYRLQRRALSPHELSTQRENLLGILSSDKTVGATNVIVDGDMEAAGTGSWTAVNDAILTKTTEGVQQGSQALRITYDGTSNPFAYQDILTVGKYYKITGFARGDGTYPPRVRIGTQNLWTGTSDSTWQKFEIDYVEAMFTELWLYNNVSGAGWAEFDDVYVYEYDDSIWDFSRTTTAYQTFSDGTIAEVAANIPRVGGKGGGVLIEGQNTQLHGFTQAFDSWVEVGTCAVTPDIAVGPDGTMYADLLDNTGGGVNDYRASGATADLGDLTGRKFIAPVWIKADTPHICTIGLVENGVSTTRQSFYVTTEWQRFYVARTCIGGGTGTLGVVVYPGQFSASTGTAYFANVNLTETTFPVSYINNDGALTTQVTRTADSMTMDPHPEVGNRILPDKFENTGALTVEFDAKCEWSGSTDINGDRRILEISGNSGTASGTRNRVQIYGTSTGRVLGMVRDNGVVDHFAQTVAVDPVNFSDWFSVKMFLDFTDLSRMNLWINKISNNTYSNNSGVAVFDTTNTLIRIGQNYLGTVNAFCSVKNLRISPSEF